MKKKKVIVIGGGIAGLSAGVYALRCGFDVTVLESHNIAGGNCTSWRRKDYLFEGGMHWLSGSDRNEPINRLWRTVGALDDSVAIHTSEPFVTYDHNGAPICFYRNVDVTEKHLLEISPEDSREIRKLCGYIRKVKNLAMPVTDIRGVKVTKKNPVPLSMLFSAFQAVRIMQSYSKVSREKYINRFKHEGIRSMLKACTTEKSGVVPIFFTMGILSRGDGGFPEGGSLPFVERIVKTFSGLGGELLCNTRADRVIIENGKAVGVMTGSRRLDADAVIVTADTMAVDHLFDIPLKSPWLDEMRKVTEPTMATFICLGINADLHKLNKYYVFKTPAPITLDTQVYEFLSISNYAGDPDYSPSGKTALTIQLGGDTYDFWKKAKEAGSYTEEKRKIAEAVIAALEAKIPDIKGKVEVIDVATPLTYERYCGNWKGSWMTETTISMKMKTYPSAIKGLQGLYFAGHRISPPGGLPTALVTGRTAVQYLCRDTGTVFVSED